VFLVDGVAFVKYLGFDGSETLHSEAHIGNAIEEVGSSRFYETTALCDKLATNMFVAPSLDNFEEMGWIRKLGEPRGCQRWYQF